MSTGTGARQGILSLTIKDKSALYAAYMPFIKGGGLFVPTKKEYRLGEEVFMLLTLMDDSEKIPVAGKIVWVTPVSSAARMTGMPATRSKAILPEHWKANAPRIPCKGRICDPFPRQNHRACNALLHNKVDL
jgi:type IV pilus assembly protein PilZ